MKKKAIVFDNTQKSFYIVSLSEDNKNLKYLSIENKYALLLTEKGELYKMGTIPFWNHEKQIKDIFSSIPEKINEFNGFRVEMVSCSHNVIHILTEEGRVFAWGTDNEKNGILGLGSILDQKTPCPIDDFPEKIKYIHTGNKHASAIDIKGNLYLWGTGYCGELGGIDNKKIDKPMFVKTKESHSYRISVCKNNFTALLTMGGTLYFYGNLNTYYSNINNNNHEIEDENNENFNNPFTIQSLKDLYVKNIVIGNGFAFCLANKGLLYVINGDYNLHQIRDQGIFTTITISQDKFYALSETNEMFEWEMKKFNGKNNYTPKIYNLHKWVRQPSLITNSSNKMIIILFSHKILDPTNNSEQNISNNQSFIINQSKNQNVFDSVYQKIWKPNQQIERNNLIVKKKPTFHEFLNDSFKRNNNFRDQDKFFLKRQEKIHKAINDISFKSKNENASFLTEYIIEESSIEKINKEEYNRKDSPNSLLQKTTISTIKPLEQLVQILNRQTMKENFEKKEFLPLNNQSYEEKNKERLSSKRKEIRKELDKNFYRNEDIILGGSSIYAGDSDRGNISQTIKTFEERQSNSNKKQRIRHVTSKYKSIIDKMIYSKINNDNSIDLINRSKNEKHKNLNHQNFNGVTWSFSGKENKNQLLDNEFNILEMPLDYYVKNLKNVNEKAKLEITNDLIEEYEKTFISNNEEPKENNFSELKLDELREDTKIINEQQLNKQKFQVKPLNFESIINNKNTHQGFKKNPLNIDDLWGNFNENSNNRELKNISDIKSDNKNCATFKQTFEIDKNKKNEAIKKKEIIEETELNYSKIEKLKKNIDKINPINIKSYLLEKINNLKTEKSYSNNKIENLNENISKNVNQPKILSNEPKIKTEKSNSNNKIENPNENPSKNVNQSKHLSNEPKIKIKLFYSKSLPQKNRKKFFVRYNSENNLLKINQFKIINDLIEFHKKYNPSKKNNEVEIKEKIKKNFLSNNEKYKENISNKKNNELINDSQKKIENTINYLEPQNLSKIFENNETSNSKVNKLPISTQTEFEQNFTRPQEILKSPFKEYLSEKNNKSYILISPSVKNFLDNSIKNTFLYSQRELTNEEKFQNKNLTQNILEKIKNKIFLSPKTQIKKNIDVFEIKDYDSSFNLEKKSQNKEKENINSNLIENYNFSVPLKNIIENVFEKKKICVPDDQSIKFEKFSFFVLYKFESINLKLKFSSFMKIKEFSNQENLEKNKFQIFNLIQILTKIFKSQMFSVFQKIQLNNYIQTENFKNKIDIFNIYITQILKRRFKFSLNKIKNYSNYLIRRHQMKKIYSLNIELLYKKIVKMQKQIKRYSISKIINYSHFKAIIITNFNKNLEFFLKRRNLKTLQQFWSKLKMK